MGPAAPLDTEPRTLLRSMGINGDFPGPPSVDLFMNPVRIWEQDSRSVTFPAAQRRFGANVPAR